jgi:Carboxypeptidase regulatory-like domain/Putative zinc-finger
VTERIQIGIHPDADQISLILEGAATEHERAQMLEHLAHCAACREMVFLARSAEPVAIPEGGRRVSWWRRGWVPFGLAGAALAFSLALVIYMRKPGAPMGDRQVAVVQPAPASPVNGPRPTTEEEPTPPARSGVTGGNAGRLAAPARKAVPGVGSGAGGGLGAGIYQAAPQAAPTLAANDQVMEAARGNMARHQQNSAAAAPAAPPVPPPGVVAPAPASASVILGENPGSQQQQASAAAKAAQGVLHDEGLGEVSGVVTDQSGAAIAQASVSLNGAADKAVREVATGPDGRFRIADVPAGRYELRVTARGFMTASESFELKSRDVAMLEPMLRVGAASQTVSVEANNSAVETQQVEATGANVVQEILPGGAAATARVAMGGRMLSMDAAGNLYLSKNAGRSWKKIKPKWTGKAALLAVVPAAEKAGQVFELTTDSGAVWTSEDGKHWRARVDGNR